VRRMGVMNFLLLTPSLTLMWLSYCMKFILISYFGGVNVFGGCVSVAMSLFPLDLLVVCTNRISCLLSYLLCAGVRWAGYFCFEIRSWCQATILFDLIWCSLVYRGWGVPCWFGSKVWESAFWFEIRSQLFGFSWFLGFCFVLFRWIGGREVLEAACSFG